MTTLKCMFRAGILGTLLALAMGGMAQATELPLPDQPHIVVDGRGEVVTVPDRVKIMLHVEETAKTLSDAKVAVDKRVQQIIEVAKAQGLMDTQINASRIAASPQYRWDDGKQVYLGEQIRREIELTLDDVSRYNQLVNGLLETGLTRLDNTRLEHKEQEALEAQALTKALDDAKMRAEAISKHLGTPLDGVFQIAPVGSQPQHYGRMEMRSAKMEKDEGAGGLQIAEQTIEQQIRVVFLLRSARQACDNGRCRHDRQHHGNKHNSKHNHDKSDAHDKSDVKGAVKHD